MLGVKADLVAGAQCAVQSSIQVCGGVLHAVKAAGNVDRGSKIGDELPLQAWKELSSYTAKPLLHTP